ncbi:hypothetical protein [Aliamphritea spongicola]|nr:hypothetical protein [Aliamphritea spongicola]
MRRSFSERAACIEDLKQLARRRIPKFAYEYLVNGCNSNCAVNSNRQALDALHLFPDTSQIVPSPLCNAN